MENGLVLAVALEAREITLNLKDDEIQLEKLWKRLLDSNWTSKAFGSHVFRNYRRDY